MHCLVVLAFLHLLAAAASIQAKDLSSSVDWRGQGVLPKVRNQGQVGDSGGIAIVESIEAFWAIKHGQLVAASLTEYENCCNNNNSISSGFECIAKMGGLASDEEYPRDSKSCMYQKYKPMIIISGGKSVVPEGDEMALAEALAEQPIAVTVDASRASFMTYKSGVYSDHLCSSTKFDHMMLLVGYGTENGVDYWICQNSWGESMHQSYNKTLQKRTSPQSNVV